MAVPLVVVSVVLLALSYLTLALRCFVRISRKALWLLFTITVIMSTLGAYHGLGVHNYGAPIAEMREGIMWFSLWQIFYVTSTVPVKTSICVTLIRLTPELLYKRILWALIAGSIISTIMACIVVFTTCRPMAFTWDKTIPGGKCNSIETIIAMSYLVSGINIITDWTCAIMPVIIVWSIQLKLKLKVSVSVILGMGVLASIATLIRLKTIPAYKNTNDFLYGIAEIAIWSAVEIGLGIIAGSAAALKPLFNKLFGSTGDQRYSSDRVNRPCAGSYELHDMAADRLPTPVVGKGEVDNSDISHEDAASQRRILGAAGTPGGGIMASYDISVNRGLGAEDKSGINERRAEELV
ncbi:hypothetical protein K432DRAFT_340970 [Lepidopterella palustris CBS 459.81]|uniref:Rhodopsin domain-containing protein n=1 Tax=Lepidopterella palustris CBS 459.81 TaxID=1314670 RepID=A0A8E2DWI4_9PEZI|nr:hypothetical protein K432DRAFT_340970 [Lepidopterella palustris CBS 459.81]